MLDIHGVFLYTDFMKNNIIQFEEYKQKLRTKKLKPKNRKQKYKFYGAVSIIKGRCIQGWASSKKEFLKDCASILKQLLNERNAEYFFDCHKVKISKSIPRFDYKLVQDYVIKKSKEKYKL